MNIDASTPTPTGTSTGAAFFDLDRTLLSGSSSDVFAGAMQQIGLISRDVPGRRLLGAVFNVIGETLPTMALARQAVRLVKGRSQAELVAAAEGVAGELVDLVQPFAHSVFAMHREEGRPIILATTSPYDLVKPFADLLGLDDVVATRYSVGPDGDTYDGRLDGVFTWANGKLDAVRAYAAENGIDLAESYAYSDSIYDTPMLAAVGHPVAVNPDPRMRVMAAARRWPTLHLDVSPGVAKVPGIGLELQKVVLSFARPAMVPYADIDISDVSHIPQSGPAILVANHRSYFDPMVMAMVVAKTGRSIRGLGKKEVFDVPLFGSLATAMGGIRVDRATGSVEPLAAAAAVLEGGEMVMIMPQGTIPRGPAFFDPELKGRWGAARLAQLTGAPIIPIGLWGTELVWPRSSRVPRMLNIADAPNVFAKVGPAVEVKGKSLNADTKRIMQAISKLLPPEARKPYDPTPDELARTYPPGYAGDPDEESERRPGTD